MNFRPYQNHVLVHQVNIASSEENGEKIPPGEDTSIFSKTNEALVTSSLVSLETEYPTPESMQSYAAKCILKSRENRSLTKSAMQGIITGTADIISFTTSTLES